MRQLYPEERDTILARDGHTCQECGRTGALDIHHIRPRRFGGAHDPANLITLCRKCHIHAERIAQRTWAASDDPMSSPPRKIPVGLILNTDIRAALIQEAAHTGEDVSFVARRILRRFFGLS